MQKGREATHQASLSRGKEKEDALESEGSRKQDLIQHSLEDLSSQRRAWVNRGSPRKMGEEKGSHTKRFLTLLSMPKRKEALAYERIPVDTKNLKRAEEEVNWL